jgi:hypothetical protein
MDLAGFTETLRRLSADDIRRRAARLEAQEVSVADEVAQWQAELTIDRLLHSRCTRAEAQRANAAAHRTARLVVEVAGRRGIELPDSDVTRVARAAAGIARGCRSRLCRAASGMPSSLAGPAPRTPAPTGRSAPPRSGRPTHNSDETPSACPRPSDRSSSGPSTRVLHPEDRHPSIGAQAGPAPGLAVFHLDREGMTTLHRRTELREQVVVASVGRHQAQGKRRPRWHGQVVGCLDEGIQDERRPSQFSEDRPGSAPVFRSRSRHSICPPVGRVGGRSG